MEKPDAADVSPRPFCSRCWPAPPAPPPWTAPANRSPAQAKALEPQLLETRRDIHAHPELGNTETRTSELVAKQLKAMGLEVKTNVARTGVVAILKGALPGPTVALRADMDAYRSKSPTCPSPRKPKAPTSAKKST
jgi:metal-dependent amidase/aminoacylase/carboxypeptidase family protein